MPEPELPAETETVLPVGDDTLPDCGEVGGEPALDSRGGEGGLGGGGRELGEEGGQARPHLGGTDVNKNDM